MRVFVVGCEQFSVYSGYADSFRWRGSFNDVTPVLVISNHSISLAMHNFPYPLFRDDWGRRMCEVVAMDALVFHSYREQFKTHRVDRELGKVHQRLVFSAINI